MNVRNSSSPRNTGEGQDSGDRFNSAIHGMVSEAMGFVPWKGDWMELEDWFLTWQLYTQSTSIPTGAKAVLFIGKMPVYYADFLRNKHLRENWKVEDMIDWLRKEKKQRVRLHVRHKAWQSLVPSGCRYQDLVNWYMKWKERLVDLEVTEMQVLDQFDWSVRTQFAVPMTEMLKKELEMKSVDPRPNWICLRDMSL